MCADSMSSARLRTHCSTGCMADRLRIDTEGMHAGHLAAGGIWVEYSSGGALQGLHHKHTVQISVACTAKSLSYLAY